ncbi:MAG: glycine cleavage system aminomethyltransferase GcvT [Desulfohalobiaceae bacterium]
MPEHKITPLTAWHQKNGAQMAPFAGWLMPIQYESILDEHRHTRSAAALFDICHMGEFTISGPGAGEALGRVLTHNLATLSPGRCRYGFMLNPRGGVLDDLIVYCLSPEEYMLVVNAGRRENDLAWLGENLPGDLVINDISEATAKIDLQGPASVEVLQMVMPEVGWTGLGYFAFTQAFLGDVPLLVSRTGYTGELGYEIYIPAENSVGVWEQLLADPRVLPAGLGARDTLRLEAGLPLYGQDLDEEHTPAEAGYAGMLTSKAPFCGREHAFRRDHELIGLSLAGRRSARHGDQVLLPDGSVAGEVTSGSFAPSLGHAVALAYVDASLAGQEDFLIQTSRARLEAVRSTLPFYKEGTARKKLS